MISVPLIINVDAFNYYSNNIDQNHDYDDAINILQLSYNSEDVKAWILSEYKSMVLSD